MDKIDLKKDGVVDLEYVIMCILSSIIRLKTQKLSHFWWLQKNNYNRLPNLITTCWISNTSMHLRFNQQCYVMLFRWIKSGFSVICISFMSSFCLRILLVSNIYNLFTSRYSWNTAKVSVKHQSINQYAKHQGVL